MKSVINSIGFYFLLPAYVALALLLTFFNLPENYYHGLFVFYTIITFPVLLSAVLVPLKMRMNDYYDAIMAKPQYRFISLCFCFLIMFCAPLDVYVNGFKLLNPASYADIHGIGRYVRHLTILCWVFIPVAFIYLKSPCTKLFFISYALIFPILIIDRNRFFISCYSLLLCVILVYSSPRRKIQSQFFGKLLFWLIPIGCLLTFALIGHFRSGSAFIVASSGTVLREGAYPLADSFASLPGLLQQIILYVTTPIFNFATIVSDNFINQDFLLSQLSPFSRENFELYPYAPILVPRFNVGTEFYPFLLYGGLSLVAWAFVLMLISFILAFYLFKTCPNIFTFLIFLRVSYNALFMGFAPQFFILLNLMFVMLILFYGFLQSL